MPVNTLYCLCVERNFEMIIGMLAILKSGGTYVPLDANDPKNRLLFILEDIRLQISTYARKIIK